MKICFVVSAPMTAIAFLVPHLRRLEEVHVLQMVANTDEPHLLRNHDLSTLITPIPIERNVRLLDDARAFLLLYRYFRRERFDVVHSVTPKAGLLAMLAATSARVPVRVHWFTGQVWATREGWQRKALKSVDMLLGGLTTHALVDSPKQRDFLIRENVLRSTSSEVLGDGSICGVDLARFRPDDVARTEVRNELGIPPEGVLAIFLGRMNRDKGLADLAAAFQLAAKAVPELWLLLVGPDEGGMKREIERICAASIDRLRFVGFSEVPERYLAAADIFCLPSYREGFGSSVIEAAACGLPAIVSRIYGLEDAVVENETALTHLPGDVSALGSHIKRLARDRSLREKMSEAAYARVSRDFTQERITKALCDFYRRIETKELIS